MIGYLDTSAFVPLIIAEPTSPACRRLWDDADTLVACRLLYVETAAALAQARRLKRLPKLLYEQSLSRLDELWLQVEILEVDEHVMHLAADLARRFDLRGYDAVHGASAVLVSDTELVAASGDKRLIQAWAELGVDVFDVNE